MKDFKKLSKYLADDFIFVLALYGVYLLALFILGGLPKFSSSALILIVVALSLMVVGAILAKKEDKNAGVIGVVTSVLMIIASGWVLKILGVFQLIHSIYYLINYKKD